MHTEFRRLTHSADKMQLRRRTFYLILLPCQIVAWLLFISLDEIGAMMFPVPLGITRTRSERQALSVVNYPTWYLGVLLAGWALIIFVFIWIAARKGGTLAALVSNFAIAGYFTNATYHYRYPIWFWIVAGVNYCLVLSLIARIEKIGRYAPKIPEQT